MNAHKQYCILRGTLKDDGFVLLKNNPHIIAGYGSNSFGYDKDW